MAAGGSGSAARLLPLAPASKPALVMARHGSQHVRQPGLLNEMVMVSIKTSVLDRRIYGQCAGLWA